MKTSPLLILGRAFFFLGVVMGFALSVIAIWNNVESTSYFFRGAAYAAFDSLRCPVMVSPTEKGIVTAFFDNPTDEEDVFYYRVQISRKGSSTRNIEDRIAVPPHQATRVQWTVDARDIDLRFFILVKITIVPSALHPPQEAVCGIIVANILGLTGSQASTAALLLSLSGMAVGLGLGQQTSTKAQRDPQRLARALGLVVLLALVATSMSWWAVAIVLSVITLLLLVISIRFAVD